MSKLLNPDSNQFPKCMRWLARDADGQWWVYEHEPHLAETNWYENEVGKSVRVKMRRDVSRESLDWKETLKKIG